MLTSRERTQRYATMPEKHPQGPSLQAGLIVPTNHRNRLDRCNRMRMEPPKHPAAVVSLNVSSVTQGDRSQIGPSPPRSARQLVQDKLGRRYSEVSLK